MLYFITFLLPKETSILLRTNVVTRKRASKRVTSALLCGLSHNLTLILLNDLVISSSGK